MQNFKKEIKPTEVKELFQKEFLPLVKQEYPSIDYILSDIEQLGFFTAPASTKYHLPIEGGLALHSLNVLVISLNLYNQLKEINCSFNFTQSDLIIAAFLHDIGKIGFHKNPIYLKESNNEYIYNQNSPLTPRDLGLYYAGKYNFPPHVTEAIALHDGGFVEQNKIYGFKTGQLTKLVMAADILAVTFLE
ncbi:MAG: HD domain-containing protein [Nanopusillaceae archaeon]